MIVLLRVLNGILSNQIIAWVTRRVKQAGATLHRWGLAAAVVLDRGSQTTTVLKKNYGTI